MRKRRLISILAVLSLICSFLPVVEASAASEAPSGGMFDVCFGKGMVLDCQRSVTANTDDENLPIDGYQISANHFTAPYSVVTNERTDLGTDYLKLEYVGMTSGMAEETKAALKDLVANAEDTAPVFKLVRYTSDGTKIEDFSNVGYITYCGEGLSLMCTVRGGTATNSYGYFLQARIVYQEGQEEGYSGATDQTLTECSDAMQEFLTLKQLEITTATDETVTVYVVPDDTAASVKAQIKAKRGAGSEVTLSSGGQELADDALIDQYIGSADRLTATCYDRVISTADELKAFRDEVNEGDSFYGKTIILTADIDLDGSAADPWIPIGHNKVFEGTFDGQGHTISGLYAADDTADSIALFGVAWGAEIKNVKLAASTLIGNNYVGGIVSHSQKRTASGVDTYPKITNCTVEDTVTITGNRTTGGIAGQFSGTIENCLNNAKITVTDKGEASNGNKDLCGGIVGYLNAGEGEILNCVNNGDVTGIYTVGGIAGDSNGKIENCINNGTVTAKCDTDNSNFSMVGGIVGNLTGAEEYTWCTGELLGCLNTGDVTATGLVVGGVAGYVDGAPLTNVINHGNVTGSAYVGGITGLCIKPM